MTLDLRIGHGWDVHRFGAARPLRLGGVEIPSPQGGLHGHSDADVLVHAVARALLGSLALGDLGAHFPDTEPRWKDACSLDLLGAVLGMVQARGYRVLNCDTTLIAETPRLAPYLAAMRRNLAEALQVDAERISVQATSAEGLGALGRLEGIAAQAALLVGKVDAPAARS